MQCEIPDRSTKLLPVHGIVLAGGQSSRMGRDKAMLRFLGRPMVEIGVEKLRTFCAEVSIAGNRDDLVSFAPVIHEQRTNVGPGAGIEAGLRAARQEWVMFIPVDVPLVPAGLLRNWAVAVLERSEVGAIAALLLVAGERQPAFCMCKGDCLQTVSDALDLGKRRLNDLLDSIEELGWGWLWPHDATEFSPIRNPAALQMQCWFSNVNTPQELAEAEAWANAVQNDDSSR